MLTSFSEGFAQLLAAASIGLTWSPDGLYTTGQTGIWIARVPTAPPNRVLTLTPYPLTDEPVSAMSEIGLQVRTRSAGPDPRDVFTLDDAVADALLGNFPLVLPNGIRVSTLIRSSSGSLGQDDAHLWNWASNYTAAVNRPSPHRN